MKLKKLIDVEIEKWLLIISFIFLILLVLVQVLARYIFSVPVGWNAELSRYLLIWITWISASYAIRMREHIRITLLVDRFSPKGKKITELFVIFVWSAFAFAMAFVGTEVVLSTQMLGQQTSSLGIPMWIVYIIIPLSGVLMIIRLVQQVYFIIKDKVELTN
ncbi:TRAP transporter small permease [Virgibacillus sp. NKC19-3]|uniref:TRAP transporter small permease n=1 Tax=Virgibacillus saliphilus TaxID=2831674 RepID=UPI001C9B6E2A|nr:TRAP transporter small permease [Virgibacillus sp. NKC19-3]MBY7144519.1 TRAP transporter small permease [Virgibacillus sp. NKC19-3]